MLKQILKMEKNTGKVREICQSEKVETVELDPVIILVIIVFKSRMFEGT